MILVYFNSDPTIENIFETMNEELIKVATWFKANKLSLNISKTKHPLFHSTRKREYVQAATNRLFNVQMYAKKKNTVYAKFLEVVESFVRRYYILLLSSVYFCPNLFIGWNIGVWLKSILFLVCLNLISFLTKMSRQCLIVPQCFCNLDQIYFTFIFYAFVLDNNFCFF